eukprot:CAMPEP_0118904976 /NCGR_PEP_ID=MMETSP1166-20130328/9215_1 /TAXON_ID=1104430 /ORGANISM="Chrysoreinhardia sp, Strain CCMP3193" /LENGTH=404 /DNA_ID=CAMNT_0006844245 /DNA_START=6 /DNA_END=1220 /DNA_ORIENTATION=+
MEDDSPMEDAVAQPAGGSMSSPAAAATLAMEPNFALAQDAFRYGSSGSSADEAKVKAAIAEKKMGPFYEWCCGKFGWAVDEAWLAEMKASNEAETVALEAKLEEARRNAGDMEVLDCLFEKARFYARIGDKDKAYKANSTILTQAKVSSGKKLDAAMNTIRVSLFYLQTVDAKEQLAEAKKLAETGGDWDRNNRLAVYEAVYLLANRDVEEASKLLLAGVATFNGLEICKYSDFVFYAVLTNVLTLPRPELKKHILQGPDVLQVSREMPHLRDLVAALYDCDYAKFFHELIHVDAALRGDRYLGPHARFLVRELRVLAYTQFLDAYKSVTLEAMANKFGVSLEFLDKELAHFVSCGRLTCKIDKVMQVVHTTRADHNSAQYQNIIKHGDLLLNHIQKLARVVSV